MPGCLPLAEDDKPMILLPLPPNAGVTGVHHRTLLTKEF